MAMTAAHRAILNADKRAKRAAMTPEQRELHRAAERERHHRRYATHREQIQARQRANRPARIRKPLTPEQRELQNAASRRYDAKHRVANPPGHRTAAEAQAADAAKPPSAGMMLDQSRFEKVVRAAIEQGTVEHGKWYSETGETEEILLKFDANPPSFLEGRQSFVVPQKSVPKADLEAPRL